MNTGIDLFDTAPDDYVVTCTGQDDDDCATDPALGRCKACGFVSHDIPTSAESAHDDLCCGLAEPCTGPDLCVTHERFPS